LIDPCQLLAIGDNQYESSSLKLLDRDFREIKEVIYYKSIEKVKGN